MSYTKGLHRDSENMSRIYMPNRIPEPAERALRELTWHLVATSSKLSPEANDVARKVVEGRSAAKGPIHLAAYALRLARNLDGYVVAVGYLDEYKSGYVAVSGLPAEVFPSDYVAVCKLRYGFIEACNDVSLMDKWDEGVNGKNLMVVGLRVNDALAIIYGILRRES